MTDPKEPDNPIPNAFFITQLQDRRTKKVFSDGTIEIGHFKKGKLEGDGLRIFPDELVEMTEDEEEVEPYPNGHREIKRQKGIFKDGELNGKGEILFFDGRVYEGDFNNGILVKGIKKNLNIEDSQIVREEGTFVNDQLTGNGEIELKNGKVKRGTFKDGIRQKPGKMQIFVLTLDGHITTLNISLIGKTVYDLKKKLEKKEGGYPADQMRLLLAGKQLQDDHLLKDYKIGKETTLHLLFSLKAD